MAIDSSKDEAWNRQVEYMAKVYEKEEKEQRKLDQYKNNWEELKKHCKEEIEEGNKKPDDYVKYGLTDYVKACVGTYKRILIKMKELEEDK